MPRLLREVAPEDAVEYVLPLFRELALDAGMLPSALVHFRSSHCASLCLSLVQTYAQMKLCRKSSAAHWRMSCGGF
jgi:hypothetical protein